MRNLRTFAPLLLAGLLLIAACDSGADDAGTPADSVTADTRAAAGSRVAAGCARLVEAALERAVGFDVVMNDNANGNCIATPANGAPTEPTVDFRVEPRTAAFDYFSAQPDATPIDDLGDRAVWATLNETTGYVVAVRDGKSFVVGIGDVDGVDTASRAHAEAIARLLLDDDGR